MRHQSILDQFLSFVGLTRAPETVQIYRNKLRPMLRAWEVHDVSTWRRPLFEAWLAHGKAKGWSPRQFQMTLTACRLLIGYFRDLAEEGEAPLIADFTKGVTAPKVMVVPPVIYTREEVQRLLDAGRDSRWELVTGLCALLGLRRGEVLRARWETDVNWATGDLLVHGYKTHKTRTLSITPKMMEILERHKKPSGPMVSHGSLRNFMSSFRGLCKRAGVEARGLHPMRHACATWGVERGCDLPTMAEILGHSDIQMTRRYAHSSPARMRTALINAF